MTQEQCRKTTRVKEVSTWMGFPTSALTETGLDFKDLNCPFRERVLMGQKSPESWARFLPYRCGLEAVVGTERPTCISRFSYPFTVFRISRAATVSTVNITSELDFLAYSPAAMKFLSTRLAVVSHRALPVFETGLRKTSRQRNGPLLIVLLPI